MNLLVYAGKVIACSAILFGYYYVFLRNKKFHRYNRFYVLAATAFSVIFPLFRIPVFQNAGAASGAWLQSLQVISLSGWEDAFVVTVHTGNPSSVSFNWQIAAWIAYAGGFIISSIPVWRSWIYIKKISRKYKKETLSGVTFYSTREPGTPFSFFQSLFWNEQIPSGSEQGRYILQHELFHINEKHSCDVLFIQLLANLFWFNPFFSVFLKELQTVHEFQADEWASYPVNKYDYAELLVTQAIEQKRVTASHQFYHHQIKRRIAMIIKQQPSRSNYVSRFMTLPLLFVLFFQVSCTRNNESPGQKISPDANTQQQPAAGITPAPEFVKIMEQKMSAKETNTSCSMRSDSARDLIIFKFQNGDSIMTQLSELRKLALQKQGGRPVETEPIFTKMEGEASYPGGIRAYMQFLNKTFHYPKEALAKEIQGTVVVEFMVDKKGNVSEISAISGPATGGLREEAVRVIRASGKWIPATQNGHVVNSYKKQPIIFMLN